MSDHRVRAPRWLRLAVAALLTVMFAVLVKSVQADGRSLKCSFGVNWLLMGWAIVVGRFVLFRFPAGYYRLRRFERDGLHNGYPVMSMRQIRARLEQRSLVSSERQGSPR